MGGASREKTELNGSLVMMENVAFFNATVFFGPQ